MSMKTWSCKFASCGVDVVPLGEGVRIVAAGYDVRFCSWLHGIKWMLAMASTLETEPDRKAELFRSLAELGGRKGVL